MTGVIRNEIKDQKEQSVAINMEDEDDFSSDQEQVHMNDDNDFSSDNNRGQNKEESNHKLSANYAS